MLPKDCTAAYKCLLGVIVSSRVPALVLLHNVDDLKQHRLGTWSGLQQSVIDEAMDQTGDTNCCVKANGRQCNCLNCQLKIMPKHRQNIVL